MRAPAAIEAASAWTGCPETPRPGEDAMLLWSRADSKPPSEVVLQLRRAALVVSRSAFALTPALACVALRRDPARRATALRHFYRRLTGLLMVLGPTFVKVGQVLGTRRDVLP